MPEYWYPRGIGASAGPVPSGYVEVHRWASLREVHIWMKNGGTYIPGGLGAGGRLYVTAPDAPQPPATGPCRIEFFFPEAGLQVAGHPLWYQVVQPVQNTPVYNVKIFVP